jgi:riboflavin kinase/FMN adenylyltransferase
VATRLVRNHEAPLELSGPVITAIGNFDGVHLGHQTLFRRMNEVRQRLAGKEGVGATVLISFYPHPSQVIAKAGKVAQISTLRQKLDLLSRFDIDVLYLIRFTESFSKMPAAKFLDEYMFRRLSARHIVLGPDAGVGYKREGTTPFIQDYFSKQGATSEVLTFFVAGEDRVSSKRIRSLIAEGRTGEARDLMGHSYALEGRVVHGDGRGAGIGFPTANISTHGQVLPALGVYATRCTVGGRTCNSVTNVGKRPTFGGEGVRVETHLLDFQGDSFYGERISVSFVEKLRDEMKFSGIDHLIKQIGADVERAREVLG